MQRSLAEQKHQMDQLGPSLAPGTSNMSFDPVRADPCHDDAIEQVWSSRVLTPESEILQNAQLDSRSCIASRASRRWRRLTAKILPHCLDRKRKQEKKLDEDHEVDHKVRWIWV